MNMTVLRRSSFWRWECILQVFRVGEVNYKMLPPPLQSHGLDRFCYRKGELEVTYQITRLIQGQLAGTQLGCQGFQWVAFNLEEVLQFFVLVILCCIVGEVFCQWSIFAYSALLCFRFAVSLTHGYVHQAPPCSTVLPLQMKLNCFLCHHFKY